MKKFLLKFGILFLVFFICFEIISRLFIDPIYFHFTNTYNLKQDVSIFTLLTTKRKMLNKQTKHVDYLFIGNSRIPATINSNLIMKKAKDKITIVAGRGYMTPGIHYQALKNKLSNYPNYLKESLVFIGYPGSGVYTDNFKESELKVFEPSGRRKAIPHLLLPHLTFKSLFIFLKRSRNSLKVKIRTVLLYTFSCYRTSAFIKGNFYKLNNSLIFTKKDAELVSSGGIRNDNLEAIRKKAIDVAQMKKKLIKNKPLLTSSMLDNSSLCKLHKLITENGGKLFLYKMPLHSAQQNVHASIQAIKNKKTFDNWLLSKNIQVIHNDKFEYQDKDFPDVTHLSKNRRNEFTNLMYENILKLKIKSY